MWAAFILYLCLVPSGHLPTIKIPNLDKIVHFTFYLVLVWLMAWGWTKQTAFNALHRNQLIKVFVVACMYGLLIEVLQELFTTTRHFEWLDEGADAFGAAVGCLVTILLKRSISKG